MANFKPAFDYTMGIEDPGLTGKVTKDSGGVTRWGISQRAYPHINIPALTLLNAEVLYERDYFQPIHGYQIGDQRKASKLFDMAVNMGVKRAVMLLQIAVNGCSGSRGPMLHEDGVIGPATLIAANNADCSLLLIGLVEASRKYYHSVVLARPDEECNLKGWLTRAAKLPPECTA